MNDLFALHRGRAPLLVKHAARGHAHTFDKLATKVQPLLRRLVNAMLAWRPT